MIQYIILIGLFVMALAFISRKIYRDFSAKNECAKGCGNCEASKKSTA